MRSFLSGLFSRSALAGLVSLGCAAPAAAAITFNLVETGSAVEGTISGSVNLAGLSPLGTTFDDGAAFVNPSSGTFGVSPGIGILAIWSAPAAPTAFGPGAFGAGAFQGGDGFFLNTGSIFVPAGYTSGGSLSSSVKFAGATLASLGITPGTYVTTLGNSDTITVIATPIPEPGVWAMMAAGLGVLGAVARRRRA